MKKILNVLLVITLLVVLLALSYDIYSLINAISNYNVNKQFASVAVNAAAIELEKEAICRYCIFLAIYIIGATCSSSALIIVNKKVKF